MPSVQPLLDWLAGLPPVAILPVLGVLAFLEGLFPPIPADVLVAFGAFISARQGRSPIPVLVVICGGSVAGALSMYAVGRRLGRGWITRRFGLAAGSPNAMRLAEWHARYGVLAIVVSRFVPGLRAVVPPMAGALHWSATSVSLAVTIASAAWYGALTWVAFAAGTNWSGLVGTLGRLGRWGGAGALAVVAAALAARWRNTRRRRGGR